jgi:hypothetical protein
VATYPANTDLAVQAWISSLPAFNAGMVGAELPEKAEQNTSLIASGFITAFTVGGTPELYVPLRQPVVQIDTWGFPVAAGRKPMWDRANHLAEQLVAACYNGTNLETNLPLNRNGYGTVRMLQAHPLQEPHRVYSDRGYRARFRFDLQAYWIEVPS